MDVAFISTREDPASLNIRQHLLPFFSEKGEDILGTGIKKAEIGGHRIDLLTVEEPLLHLIPPKGYGLLVFLSRHSSASGKPSLSAHFTGNYSEASMGGKPRQLSVSSPSYAKAFLNHLKKIPQDKYDVTLEATHHGPLCDMPSLFVEIGSSQKQWEDSIAGKWLAGALLEAFGQQHNPCPVAVGFGGTHYCQNFNRVEFDSDIALSHICPKHHLGSLTEELVLQMVSRSPRPAKLALLDWKGIDSDSKTKIIGILDKCRIKYKKVKEVRS